MDSNSKQISTEKMSLSVSTTARSPMTNNNDAEKMDTNSGFPSTLEENDGSNNYFFPSFPVLKKPTNFDHPFGFPNMNTGQQASSCMRDINPTCNRVRRSSSHHQPTFLSSDEISEAEVCSKPNLSSTMNHSVSFEDINSGIPSINPQPTPWWFPHQVLSMKPYFNSINNPSNFYYTTNDNMSATTYLSHPSDNHHSSNNSIDMDIYNSPNSTNNQEEMQYHHHFPQGLFIDEYSLPHYVQQNPSDVPCLQTHSTPCSRRPRWVQPSSSLFKDPAAVLVLNIMVTGLGHMFMGQERKGIAYFITNIIAWILMTMSMVGILILPLFLYWHWMILLDGYTLAQRLRMGFPILKGECTNRWAKFGIGWMMGKNTILFNHNNIDECPQEWLDTMHQLTTI